MKRIIGNRVVTKIANPRFTTAHVRIDRYDFSPDYRFELTEEEKEEAVTRKDSFSAQWKQLRSKR